MKQRTLWGTTVTQKVKRAKKLIDLDYVDFPMSRQDCLDWFHGEGLTPPGKSACQHCPYTSDETRVRMYEERPDDFEALCQVDDDLRNGNIRLNASNKNPIYLHRSRKPMREIIPLIANRPVDPEPEYCQMGMCWT